MADDVRSRVKDLGEEIRTLKASLKASGLDSSAINRDAVVLQKVAELRDLKAGLVEGDDLTDAAFFERQRKEQEERERQQKLRADEERKALEAAERAMELPLVQRKIFHLFRFAGTGDSFHYEPPPRLNEEQTGFGGGEEPNPAVYLTEKWDGTTMQATRSAVFRRLDVTGKRRGKDPAHRYELKLVAWREGSSDTSAAWRGLEFLEADRRVATALTPYLGRLEALDEGLCVYFECVHTNINATFAHLPDFADLRVFDFARADAGGSWAFLPFDETIALAGRFGLPLVGWERRSLLDAEAVWAELAAAKDRHYATAEAPLEGFVVREAGGARVAKARVEHLKLPGGDGCAGSVAPAGGAGDVAPAGGARDAVEVGRGTGSLPLAYLEAIGLLAYRRCGSLA